jgi:hypothetical protein
MKNNYSQWMPLLQSARTEEDVKAAYATTFNLKYNTSDRHDLYTKNVLFEFKYDKHLKNNLAKARVLAQLLYYIRDLRYGSVDKQIPPYLVIADKNECGITETALWLNFIESDGFDWDLSPSSPDPSLVNELANDPNIDEIRIFDLTSESQRSLIVEELAEALSGAQKLINVKKVITEANFVEVFDYWKELFSSSVRDDIKISTYFLTDIQQGRSYFVREQGKVFFEFEHGDARSKKIISDDYDHFWSLYEKVVDAQTVHAIVAKIDRINDMDTRRFEGEFYTPLPFAKKGIEYLERTMGKNWHKKRIRIWDMSSGTGNLEWYLPNEMSLELYVSTLHNDEVEHCKKIFLGATCFQYDYLNDDVDKVLSPNAALNESHWKLPKQLRDELADPDIHWIVLINPPFGTAQTAGANSDSKKSISMTGVQRYMHADGLGEVSRELFEQFLYRINKEMPLQRTHLALFSKLKFINATNDRKFRDSAFQYTYERGFIFAAKNFHGTKGTFPVGMTIWNLGKREHLETQPIILDIFDKTVHKIGQKTILSVSKDKFLSTWVERPRNAKTFPAFKSAINIASSNKDTRDRIADGFIGSLLCAGNDPQHSNLVGLFSGPFASAGAHSITPENFEKSLVVHAVRRIVPSTWINDRDQFLQPNKPLDTAFINDCVVWSLFAGSNQTSSIANAAYEGKQYAIENEFYPFTVSEISKWPIGDSDIALGLQNARDRFVASWLQNAELSTEANELLQAGKAVYKCFYRDINTLRTPTFKISQWDSGWWQIRNALADQNKAAHELAQVTAIRKILQSKLLKQIYDYGFMPLEIDAENVSNEIVYSPDAIT